MPITPAKRIITPHLVRRDFLSAEDHAALLAWTLDNQARFKPTGLFGGAVNPDFRRSVGLRDLGPSKAVMKRRLLEAAAGFVEALGASRFEVAHVELELVAHTDGALFRRHTDTVHGQAERHSDRVLSGVYYFHREPKAFSGGCLRLHRFGGEAEDDGLDVAPIQNTLVVFPASGPHEVLPVSCPSGDFADSRFAVNCWLHRARDGADQTHRS